MSLDAKCAAIELMLCDVDGVLTDGGVLIDNRGIESKQFHIHDGLGIKMWQRAGYRFGLLTGRTSHIVKVRADEIGVEIVRQGIDDKLTTARGIVRDLGLDMAQLCYVGDDLPDLPLVRAAGVGVAVADACGELRQAADHVTANGGGRGAIRETIEYVLRAQGRWQGLVAKYNG